MPSTRDSPSPSGRTISLSRDLLVAVTTIRIPDLYNSGNLEEWAKQGVLLLNTSLSVIDSMPGSHANIGWSLLVDSIIATLNNKTDIIFLLWGNSSAKKEKLINKEVNHVLKSAHPSPLSSYKGFFGCKHFSKTNNILLNMNKSPIKW